MQLVIKKPNLSDNRQLVTGDLQNLNELILSELTSIVPMINDITNHVIASGGKRLRPLIVLIMAKALGYNGKSEHCELAAVIEFIHTATLLHDDVVDSSDLRRNKSTANLLWGNSASVLAGDFLYSRAFQILARSNNLPIMQLLANTTNLIAEGEVIQLMNCKNIDLCEDDYFNIIQRKTAQLYSAASEIGAMLATPDNDKFCNAAAKFGLHLGLAFQMIDDLLDYTADPKATGKNLGDDLAEGKITLPLIYTMHNGSSKQQDIVRNAIKNGGKENIHEVIAAITESGGCQYTFEYAKKEAAKSQQFLNNLPENYYRAALGELCNFVLLRDY